VSYPKSTTEQFDVSERQLGYPESEENIYHGSYSKIRPQVGKLENHTHSQGIGSHPSNRCLFRSKTKDRNTAPPYVFCGAVSGNATGKTPNGFVKKTAGISLFHFQNINGNRLLLDILLEVNEISENTNSIF